MFLLCLIIQSNEIIESSFSYLLKKPMIVPNNLLHLQDLPHALEILTRKLKVRLGDAVHYKKLSESATFFFNSMSRQTTEILTDN